MHAPDRFGSKAAAVLIGLTLFTGCLRSYELSLGGQRRKPTAQHRNDAGPLGDAASNATGAGAPHDAAIDAAVVTTCSSDDDCAGGARKTCDPDRHVCYECMSNSDCQERPEFPHCNLDTRDCEGCVRNAECQNGTTCQGGLCVR